MNCAAGFSEIFPEEGRNRGENATTAPQATGDSKAGSQFLSTAISWKEKKGRRVMFQIVEDLRMWTSRRGRFLLITLFLVLKKCSNAFNGAMFRAGHKVLLFLAIPKSRASR